MRTGSGRSSLHPQVVVPLVVALALCACSGHSPRIRPTAAPVAATATTIPSATGTPAPAFPVTPAAAGPCILPPGPCPIPASDPIDLARRLLHLDAPQTVNLTPPVYRVGQEATFWVEATAANQSDATTVAATLRYVGAHAYFYLQNGVTLSDAKLAQAGQDFDTIVYPLVVADVGPPSIPGIDDDPRITILVADLKGMGGYFTRIDDEPSAIERTSNQRKMIYVDIASARPGAVGFDGFVAHEFQHLVHFNRNPASQTWINEGLSEVMREQVTKTLLNIPKYEAAPDTQLTDWPTLGEGDALPHYGAAHAFLRYLLQHYGGIGKAGVLAAEPGDGIAEVRAFLQQGGYGVSFEDVLADWLAADLINDPAGGRWSQNDPAFGLPAQKPLAMPSDTDATVHQFGANYYRIDPHGQALTVDFQGTPNVEALPAPPAAGGAVWWSQRGDSIDSTLTRAINLHGVAQATLHFSTWYDIERDYDFGYVEVSTDGGASWTALTGAHTTTANPLGLALGPAYTGQSGGNTAQWIDETVNLSAFAGEQILLRFEYVTDESANRNGWAIDMVRIPEIGFASVPSPDSGWEAKGFALLTGPLPERYIVQAVFLGGPPNVERVSLDENNRATLRIPPGSGPVVLIVSGVTDRIRTPATYHLSVAP
jgi:immune inhibitor A